MTDDTRHHIALFRYKLISPVLAEPARIQNAYFREQTEKQHDIPHVGPRLLKVSTLKRWLRCYRQGGFEALKPKQRSDGGRPRRLSQEAWALVCKKCQVFPEWTVVRLYDDLKDHDQLGDPPISYNTLARLVKLENLLPKAARSDVRKRFEQPAVNELWICDFMHGPDVTVDSRSRKAILCAIIDDHSRMIVGAQFHAHETVFVLTLVLKDAFLAYGLPKRLYVDNGAAFSSELLASACARAGLSLIHSKPYDSPSRGKIERFFRTVRQRFLPGLQETLTLEQLNVAFACWLQDQYHHHLHRGIDARPIDRYQASAGCIDIRRLSAAELDEIFLIRHERIVNNDATISFRGRIYEVPSAYIRQRIELRHPVDNDQELTLYDGGQQIATLKRVDKIENAQTFRPTTSTPAVSFAQSKVMR